MKIQLITLSSVLIIIASSTAFAKAKYSLADALMPCAQISNDDQRLACFDKLVQSNITTVKTTNITNTSNEQVTAIASAKVKSDVALTKIEKKSVPVKVNQVAKPAKTKSKAEQQIDDFSKESIKKAEPEQSLDSIHGTISKLKQLLRGQWVINLTNGQKWQQQGSDRLRLKTGDSVRLKKGTMGAVYLYKEGSNRSIRVKRLK